jgi:hypothetical protein
MGLNTEMQMLAATRRTVELIEMLFAEQQRTNQLLEALIAKAVAPSAQSPTVWMPPNNG